MRSTYLFGNGLARCFSDDHYNLPAITMQVRSILSGMQVGAGTLLDSLETLVIANNPDDAGSIAEDDFERIAGPIDRLAYSLLQLGILTPFAASLEEKALLESMSTRMRNLYKQIVGAVLMHVTNHSVETGSWEPINKVADVVVEQARKQGRVDVFTLNYDALLDSALLKKKHLHGGFNLADEFLGFGEQDIPVLMKSLGLKYVQAHPWREEPFHLEHPAVWLHHLHGASTWMTYQGRVFKAKNLEQIRTEGLFEAWAMAMEGQGGADQVEPVVLLGDQKDRAVALPPFIETYESLAVSIQTSGLLIIGGYSFKDRPLNRVLRNYLPPDVEIVVVDPAEGIEALARHALGLTDADARLKCVAEPLPAGLQTL